VQLVTEFITMLRFLKAAICQGTNGLVGAAFVYYGEARSRCTMRVAASASSSDTSTCAASTALGLSQQQVQHKCILACD
jgi:hypothetical protein